MTRPVLAVALLCLGLSTVPATAADEGPRLDAQALSGLELRNIGPALMSGRISDIAIDPTDPSTWYIAVGSGGVWKTQNAGTTFEPIFDAQPSYSIGCVTLDPSNPDVVWVGTGENVSGRHVAYGDGVYLSRDAGASWENVGLAASEHIGSIVVDPRDGDRVYVAAQGPLWSGGGERGVYRTVDGGANWELVLAGANEWTGANEVHMDPANPDVLYASMHQRLRNVAALINGGPGSGIFRSTDGGDSWEELSAGLPEEDMGKIGLAISPQRPDVVYATVELAHRGGGFYRSEDGGQSWEKRNDWISGGTGPHYYQEIFADPHRFDSVYQVDVWMRRTDDGGHTLEPVNSEYKHSDAHALAFHPDDPDWLLSGVDGGLYVSHDRGDSWQYLPNLPVTQFYKVAVDNEAPFYHVIGGTQDNNTQYGPARTPNVHGIRNSDWRITLFGDGHQPAIDPTNGDIVYSEWQQGNLTRWDRPSGEMVYIQPQPAEGEPADRWNWDAPIVISSHDPATLYFASHRVWRSDDRGDSWTAISGDLSHGKDRLTEPMMGRVWSFDAIWDLYAMSQFGTISSLAESPLDAGLLYAGTDDGRLHVSEDGGASWRDISKLPEVPRGYFVNDIKADRFDADVVYVAVDNHKAGDFAPYLFRSDDRGRSWRSLSGDLPERHLVWRVVQDHVQPSLLFAATEFGAFTSVDAGGSWVELTGGVPTISFRDLVVQEQVDDLVLASFGRGFYVLDDYSPLREISEQALGEPHRLFAPRQAWWYVEDRVLGGSTKASQGDQFYVAPNPPFGATFTYWLRDGLKKAEEERKEREAELAEAGEDTPYPGWDALREEELEEDPAILLTIRDAGGEVVRRIEGPAEAGLHRVSWDLKGPDEAAWRPGGSEEDWFGGGGFLVAPGRYTVELAQRVDGVTTDLGASQAFEVVELERRAYTGDSAGEVAAFLDELSGLRGRADAADAALGQVAQRLEGIRATLARSTVADLSLDAAAREMERQVEQMDERLNGNERRAMANDSGPVSIQGRLGVAFLGNFLSSYGPTPTHLASMDIGRRQLAELVAQLRELRDRELPALEARLDAADVPWSPGRPLPGGD